MVMMEDIHSSKIIELNVGGKIYSTTLATLTTLPSMLKGMFSGNMKTGLTDGQGRPFIDRNPRAFFYVLEYLRTGIRIFPEEGKVSKEEVEIEFSFFGVGDPPKQEESKQKKRKIDKVTQVEFWYPELTAMLSSRLKEGCVQTITMDLVNRWITSNAINCGRSLNEKFDENCISALEYAASSKAKREELMGLLKTDLDCHSVIIKSIKRKDWHSIEFIIDDSTNK